MNLLQAANTILVRFLFVTAYILTVVLADDGVADTSQKL